MRESFTYGSVGRASGNRCLYPEPDTKSPRVFFFSYFRANVAFAKSSLAFGAGDSHVGHKNK